MDPLNDAHVEAYLDFCYWEADSQAPDPDEINERLREVDYDYREQCDWEDSLSIY